MKLFPIIGLMSGTSMDGINATIIETNGIKFKRTNINLIGQYNKVTQEMLNEYFNKKSILKSNSKFLIELERLITIDHSKLINNIKILYKRKIRLIGFHGQTVHHDSNAKESIQLGDAQLLANLTYIDVIFQFRQNDLLLGGQGAPIAPIYHQAIIDDILLKKPCCFLNIGGVANITFCDLNNLIGFDTGPGNGLMDIYCQKKLNLKYDNNGIIASKGKYNKLIINKFLLKKYFTKPFPKSLDRLEFSNILENKEFLKLNCNDALATLSEISVISIQLAINQLPKEPNKIIVCGGGQYNKYLIQRLKKVINIEIITADSLNLYGDFIEAELMAYLSARSFYNLPITFPGTTGVKKPETGGKLVKVQY